MKLSPSARITEIISGENTQKAIMAGVDLLYTPVASTLGASGRTVIIEDIHGNPKPTKDGVTVAKAIVPMDSVERMASEIIKQASLNTADEAGDGTTTSTIIARGVVERGMKLMTDKSINYTDFNKGMTLAVQDITEMLVGQSQVINLDNIDTVATISVNGDNELGGIIADAFRKAGQHGVVLMEKSETNDTYVSVTEGFELENGYTSEIFVNQEESNRCEFDEAYVLVSNVKIEKLKQIEAQVEAAITNNIPLVIVSEMEDELKSIIAMNVSRRKIKAVIIEPSHFGIRRRDILNDLSITTGAVLIDDQTGDNFDTLIKVEGFGLGKIDKVTVERGKTVFFTEPSEALIEHTEALVKQLKNESNAAEKVFLEERIAKISSAVAIVNVGAASSTAQSEIADRVDDAIHATRAALSEGIVAGGGVAFRNVLAALTETVSDSVFKEAVQWVFGKKAQTTPTYRTFDNKATQAGYVCVLEAIVDPLRAVLFNADIKYDKDDFMVKNHGIDVKTGKKGNMFDLGIIDPIKVTKTALKNGVSAASTLLSTTSIIVNLRRI